MARITMNDLMEAMQKGFNEVKTEVNSLNERVTALEGKSKKTPTVSGKGVSKLYSVELKDYEPKKSADGNYNWSSYKAKRTDYCYAVATKGKALGCYEKGVKVVDFKDIEADFNKAKEQFTKHFKYIKKADR